MDPKIKKFIQKHHLLSLATVGKEVWCSSAFYVFDDHENAFVIASDHQTRHIGNLAYSSQVAGTIAFETKIVGKIQGIQFSGKMELIEEESEKALYFDRFAYAKAMAPTLWKIFLHEVKMTDNTLGFGKKISWKRAVSE